MVWACTAPVDDPEGETPDLGVEDTPSPSTDTPEGSGATPTDSPVHDTAAPLEPLAPSPWDDVVGDLDARPSCVASAAAGGGPCLTHGVMADLDGDGVTELIVLGLGGGSDEEARVGVYRWDRAVGRLVEDVAQAARFGDEDQPVFALLDLDEDGQMDLVTAGWDAPPAWGQQDGGFATEPRTPRAPYNAGMISGALGDVDRDGWIDVVQTGGCRPGVTDWLVWRRTGVRGFTPQPGWRGAGAATNPYTVGVVPPSLGEGEQTLFALGNACDLGDPGLGFWRASGLDPLGLPGFAPVDVLPLSSAWRLSPVVANAPISWLNPMGATWSDVDGDGAVDLIAATTWRALHVWHPTSGLWEEWTDRWSLTLPARAAPYDQETVKPWGVWSADFDLDGDEDVLAVGGLDPADARAGYGDVDRIVVWRTQNGRPRDEVAVPWGLGAWASSRSLTVGDLDRDGAPDLVVGGWGRRPRVLRHLGAGARSSLALRLVGGFGNREALGAVVRVEDDGVLGPAAVIGGPFPPGPRSEAIAFLTTGSDGVADAVWVTTPEGWTWRAPGVPSGHQTLELPEVLSLTPQGRHLAPGETGWIAVTPRDLGGMPRPARVEVVRTHGDGTVGEPVRDGATWRFPVLATATPGEGRFEVRVDGVPLNVAPRWWYDGP
jgi:hypothetical protein